MNYTVSEETLSPITKKTGLIAILVLLIFSIGYIFGSNSNISGVVKSPELAQKIQEYAYGTSADNQSNQVQAVNSTPETQATTQQSQEATENASEATGNQDTTQQDAPQQDATQEDANAQSSGELTSSSSKEEILAEYIKVYNTTKATGTFTGSDSMSCDYLALEGKENSTVKNLADKFMTANATGLQLPPYSDSNPGMECLLTADEVEEASYTDNGDGTATIVIKPKTVESPKLFEDAQGKTFNVMEDVAEGLSGVSVLTWSEGDANSNVVLTCGDSTATVTYNKDTKMMTKADYVLVTKASIQHANVLLFKDKSAEGTITYTMTFPG